MRNYAMLKLLFIVTSLVALLTEFSISNDNSPVVRSIDSVDLLANKQSKFYFENEKISNEVGWPMFQYNAQHTGYNDFSTIPVPLSLKWSILDTLPLLNQVSVVGDKVLISYGRGEGHARVACLNSTDGSISWMWFLGVVWSVAQPSYGYGNVFVQVNNHAGSFISAFDLETGDNLWNTPFRAQWDRYLAPTIHRNKVLMAGGTYGGIFCLDALSGEILWVRLGAQYDRWTPAAYEDTVYMYVGSSLLTIDLNTGEIFWLLDAANPDKNISSEQSPSDMNVSAVIDTIDHISYCMNARSHFLYAFDLNERQLLWVDSAVDHGYGKNPVIYEDLLLVTQWGYMQAYDRFTGETRWIFNGDENLKYPPVVGNGYVFVSSPNNTYALDLNSLTIEWIYPVGGHLTVSENNLYVADDINSSLYAFGDIATAIEDDQAPELPTDYALHQNYPNPFNLSTEISYELRIRSFVEISIYNALGQRVKTLIKAKQSAGLHSVNWNGTDAFGKTVSSGTYFYKLIAGDFIDTKKMMLLK